jgi:glucosyl-3-phosphoglycerate synthase
LAGIIAARRSLLQTLRFENDYGVDIGLLIDATASGARLAQVDIGHLDHDSHSLEVLEEMATQVARAILNRAAVWGRLRPTYLMDVIDAERARQANPFTLMQRLPSPERIALFDMDGVLLNGRFVVELARRTGLESALAQFLDNPEMAPEQRTRQIAMLFAGVARDLFEQTAREIPLMKGAVEAVVGLRRAGFIVGITTDSYQVVAETVRRRVFADFSFANVMRFKRGKATGKLTLCPAMRHPAGCTQHPSCKANVLLHLAERLNVSAQSVLVVGDGENDICNLRSAGLSIAFQPKSPAVAAAAQYVLDDDLSELLAFIELPSASPSMVMA